MYHAKDDTIYIYSSEDDNLIVIGTWVKVSFFLTNTENFLLLTVRILSNFLISMSKMHTSPLKKNLIKLTRTSRSVWPLPKKNEISQNTENCHPCWKKSSTTNVIYQFIHVIKFNFLNLVQLFFLFFSFFFYQCHVCLMEKYSIY